jgi:hypothetical protein
MGCVDCFATLELEKIDWAGVTSETECADVVSFLNKGGYCSKLTNDRDATKAFCNTFDACVVWTDDGTGGDSDPSDPEGETSHCLDAGWKVIMVNSVSQLVSPVSLFTRTCQLHSVDFL